MIWAMAKKELLQLRRDPRLIGLIILMPLILLLLFGFALKLEPQNVKLAYVQDDSSFFTLMIESELEKEGYFDIYKVQDIPALIEEIRSGRAKAGLFIPQDFTAKLVENEQPHISFYADGTMPSLATAIKYNSNAATNENVTSQMYFLDANDTDTVIAKTPFIMDTEILFNPDEKETWFFLPGVMGVLMMQVALILTGISVVREREKQTLEQLLVTPLSKSSFVIGKLLPYVVIALFDFYFIFGAGWLTFDLPQPNSHLLLFALALIFVCALIALGLFISLVAQTQQQAMFIAIFFLVPSMLLSGFIFPIEAIPAAIRPISYIIPFTYFIDIIRGILVKHTLFVDLIPSFLALIGFVLFFVTASIIKFKRTI